MDCRRKSNIYYARYPDKNRTAKEEEIENK